MSLGSQQNHQITKVFNLLKIYAFQYEGFISLFTPLPWSRLAQNICATKQTYLQGKITQEVERKPFVEQELKLERPSINRKVG